MLQHNVLISSDNQALLTDFGLSFLANSSFSLSAPIKAGGKWPWMAPEMLDDGVNGNDGVHRQASAAGDVWSFAMTALVSFGICSQGIN